MALFELDRFSYWYPDATRPALESICATVAEGASIVSGNSGSGKSTFVSVANGLVPHFTGGRVAGHATSVGRDVLTATPAQLARNVGMVFQDPERQAVRSTVAGDIAFGLENYGMAARLINSRVDDLCARLGIAHLRERRIDTLSGGERQRVALAGALGLNPALLVLDEPTSQLDADGSRAVLEAIEQVHAGGTALLIADHEPHRYREFATCRIRLDQGAVTTDPPPESAVFSGTVPASSGVTAFQLDGVLVGVAGVPLFVVDVLAGRAGNVIAITGNNSSGKTTLLRTIAGLIPPLSGTVARFGRCAYLPQNPGALLYRESVQAEVAFTLKRARTEDDPLRLLRALNLERLADRSPRDLSSGQRQRAAIAAVLAGHPSLALLDEPTRGMDGTARVALAGLIDSLAAEGACVVIATHDDSLIDMTCAERFRVEDKLLRATGESTSFARCGRTSRSCAEDKSLSAKSESTR